ncbi:MAG: carboxymethylenebutenolidase [Limisphaerales bacterium]
MALYCRASEKLGEVMMGVNASVTSADGFDLGVYVAEPEGVPIGAVVVIQEIFGVNQHIREVTDGYASEGYYAIAPKIFDRIEQDIELGYEEADMARGIELAFQKLDHALALTDVQAAVNTASAHGKVGVVGYCFGGLLTWLSACELDNVSAASSYYGGGVAGQVDKTPNCPTIMHFGALDAHIPLTDVEKIKDAQPQVPVYVYDADHGFNCNHRGSFNEMSAKEAKVRTLAHFATVLGGR